MVLGSRTDGGVHGLWRAQPGTCSVLSCLRVTSPGPSVVRRPTRGHGAVLRPRRLDRDGCIARSRVGEVHPRPLLRDAHDDRRGARRTGREVHRRRRPRGVRVAARPRGRSPSSRARSRCDPRGDGRAEQGAGTRPRSLAPDEDRREHGGGRHGRSRSRGDLDHRGCGQSGRATRAGRGTGRDRARRRHLSVGARRGRRRRDDPRPTQGVPGADRHAPVAGGGARSPWTRPPLRSPARRSRRGGGAAGPGTRPCRHGAPMPTLHDPWAVGHREVTGGRGVRPSAGRRGDGAFRPVPALRGRHHVLADLRDGASSRSHHGRRRPRNCAFEDQGTRRGDRARRRRRDSCRTGPWAGARNAVARRDLLGDPSALRGAVAVATPGPHVRRHPLGGADPARSHRACRRSVPRRSHDADLHDATGAARREIGLGRRGVERHDDPPRTARRPPTPTP